MGFCERQCIFENVTVSFSRISLFHAVSLSHECKEIMFLLTSNETRYLGRFLSVARCGSVFHVPGIEGFRFRFIFQPASRVYTYTGRLCKFEEQSFLN
jgi:hypothetical protein